MNNIDKATIAKIVSLVVEQIQSAPRVEEVRKVALSSGLYEDTRAPAKAPRKRGRSTRKVGEKSNQPILFHVTETELAQIRQWVASGKRRPRAEMIREAVFKQIALTVK